MARIIIFCLISLLALAKGQRITTIQLDGVQYFISRMNPYSPELNYFLAYQYCRSLGLQLASFETKEKVESMTQYLQNAGYSKYDFWTSGNRLGTGMFLWMSTGLPFNATFDFFENSVDAVQAGLLDPVDHNSNTSPQRTARDSNSGLEKGCVMLKAPSLKWMPEDCSVVKDFICEQTRCYYYNYGSIPVSSAQGRPIISTTTRGYFYSTTPLPIISTTSAAAFIKKLTEDRSNIPDISKSSKISSVNILRHDNIESHNINKEHQNIIMSSQKQIHHNDGNIENEEDIAVESDGTNNTNNHDKNDNEEARTIHDDDDVGDDDTSGDDNSGVDYNTYNNDNNKNNINNYDQQHHQHIEEDDNRSESDNNAFLNSDEQQIINQQPSVEERLKQISHEIEKLGGGSGVVGNSGGIINNNNNNNDDNINHQSFLSLSDLIKTLRPNEKKIPQIDSDYSNTMRVLGETSSFIGNNNNNNNNNNDESRKLKEYITTDVINL